MTVALLFILGILCILSIARYNNSNKVFWALFVSYILAFTVGTIAYKATEKKEQSRVMLNQAYPTQGLLATQGTFVCIPEYVDYTTPVKVTSSLVSQDYTPDMVEYTQTLSDVYGVTRGLYLHVLPNPPNSVEIVDDS